MLIRPAQPKDISALRDLSESAFRNAYSWYNTVENMEMYVAGHFTEEKITGELADDSLAYFLAIDNEEITGYVKLDLKTSIKVPGKNPIEIARLYTKPQLIGKGIGKQLVVVTETFARQNNFDCICLSAWQKNTKAVKFYQREGFEITGNLEFLFGTDLQDDFLMVKRLS